MPPREMSISAPHSDTSMISDSESESIASKDSVGPSIKNELEFLRVQNKRLKDELSIYKCKVAALYGENQNLRESKCAMQVKIEAEEEFITNSLLRQISILRKNMEAIATNYEREEECIVNDLTRKLTQLQGEKERFEKSVVLEHEIKCQKLQSRVTRLESETKRKQRLLDQLRKEKADIQNTVEAEQESLINKLWRNIAAVEKERQMITEKMGECSSGSSTPKENQGHRGSSIVPVGRTFSLDLEDLHKMSHHELKNYVLSLQNELSKLQTRSSVLDPEKYQRLLAECNIKDENHWIRKRFRPSSEDRRAGSSTSLVGRSFDLPSPLNDKSPADSS